MRDDCLDHHASLLITTCQNTGSFNNWEAPIPLGKTSDTGDFVRTIALPAGTYQVLVLQCSFTVVPHTRLPQYKYLVDGQWLTSPAEPTGADDSVGWRRTPPRH